MTVGTDLVTGATGFIGRHLSERLAASGRKLRLFCRPESVAKLADFPSQSVEIVQGDLRQRDSIHTALDGVERVFHCAGHVSDWGMPETFYALNVQGTQWLLDAALQTPVERFVHLSSIAVFGVPAPAYFDDTTPYGPGKDPYSQTKIAAERLVLRYHREHGLPVTVLRPAVVYGPRGTWVEEPLRMIRHHTMFLIANGKGTCHPCYIDNLLDAMLLVADHPRAVGQAYLVGDDQPMTFQAFFNHLANIAGAKPIRRSIPLVVARGMASTLETIGKLTGTERRPLLTHTAIDMVTAQSTMGMEKIRRELDFTPRISVAAGMALLRTWIQNG